VRRRLALFIAALAIWMLLSWPPDSQHLLAGIAAAGLTALLCGDLFIDGTRLFTRPSRWGYFLIGYLPLFAWQCLKANIDAAWRILHPDLPINPGIVQIKTSLTSDIGLTFLANSITLIPGTMCVNIDKDKGILYIHWINVKAEDSETATRLIAGKFEPLLKKIFE